MIKELENFIEKNREVAGRLAPLSWYGGVYRYLLDTEKASDAQLQEISKKIESYQKSDGGFQIETQGASSSVIETAIALDFLLDIEKPCNSSVVSRAIKFLLSQQREDGGFSENLKAKHLIEWDDKYIYEKRLSTPHVTAWVLRPLLKSGLSKNSPSIAKALKYLAVSQKRDGGWSHFKSEPKSSVYLTALISIALGEFKEFKEMVDIKSLEDFLVSYQKENGSIGDCLDASLLIAEAWLSLGVNTAKPNMRKLLEWIEKQQSTNGSFMDKDCGWPDTFKNRVACSMNAARVLHKIGYASRVK